MAEPPRLLHEALALLPVIDPDEGADKRVGFRDRQEADEFPRKVRQLGAAGWLRRTLEKGGDRYL